MAKQKLYPSFTRLLYKMQTGDVAPEDLEGSLFYFGCTRSSLDGEARDRLEIRLAFHLPSQKELDAGKEDGDLDGAVQLYDTIRSAVFQAEQEGRAAFRAEDQDPSFKQLNAFLATHGIDTSTVQHLEKKAYALPLVTNNYNGLVDVMW